MPASTRTFVAIEMPGSIAVALWNVQGQMAIEPSGIRWLGPRNGFHLTLAFLGDVPNDRLPAVGGAVAAAVAPFEPLTLQVEGLGAFPRPSRARIIWAGVGGPGTEALTELQGEIASALRGAGFAIDDKPFAPHITIGRMDGRRGRAPNLSGAGLARGGPLGTFEVSEVVTFASKLGPAGPLYTPLFRAPLKA